MNQEPKPAAVPIPAPQLPNFPMSPDDPFQPDPERHEPVTPPPPDPDPAPPSRKPAPGRARTDPDTAPEQEP